MRILLPALVLMAVRVQAARMEPVTVWRGETRTTILHDHVSVGEAPAGIDVRVGVAKDVRYLDRPFGTHYSSFADRVVWGSSDLGVKVLSVSASADVNPGVYLCGDVEVTVLDRLLQPASEWKYHLDLWQHPWAVARWHGVKPFTAAHYAAMRLLWTMLAEAGQKALTVTLIDLPWNHQCYDAYHSMVGRIKHADGSWTFDYSVLDEYVAFGRSCGIGPEIACYTMCPWEYEVRWQDESGVWQGVKAVPGSPEFKEYWGVFLTDFERHVREKGWLGEVYIALDERSPEDVVNVANFIREKAPGLKLSLAGNRSPSQFKGCRIDHCCFGLKRLTDELIAEADDRRSKGMLTTYYVCCAPDYPNTFCSSEIEEAFWLGAYPAFAGLDGFLRWAWNSWPQDPIRDASYTGIKTGWKSGDTYLVYPDGAPSLRFLELRNGIVAAEKVRILKESGCLTRDFETLKMDFDRHQAMSNKTDFVALRTKVLDLVNKQGGTK